MNNNIILEQVFFETVSDIVRTENQNNIDNLIECINLEDFENISESYIDLFINNYSIYEMKSLKTGEFGRFHSKRAKDKAKHKKVRYNKPSKREITREHTRQVQINRDLKNAKKQKDIIDKTSDLAKKTGNFISKTMARTKLTNAIRKSTPTDIAKKAISGAIGVGQKIARKVSSKKLESLKNQRKNELKKASEAAKKLKNSSLSNKKRKKQSAKLTSNLAKAERTRKKTRRIFGKTPGVTKVGKTVMKDVV